MKRIFPILVVSLLLAACGKEAGVTVQSTAASTSTSKAQLSETGSCTDASGTVHANGTSWKIDSCGNQSECQNGVILSTQIYCQ